jgi:hypothetical protein
MTGVPGYRGGILEATKIPREDRDPDGDDRKGSTKGAFPLPGLDSGGRALAGRARIWLLHGEILEGVAE